MSNYYAQSLRRKPLPGNSLLRELQAFRQHVKNRRLKIAHSKIYTHFSAEQKDSVSFLFSSLDENIESILRDRNPLNTNYDFDLYLQKRLGKTYEVLCAKLSFIRTSTHTKGRNGSIQKRRYNEIQVALTDADASIKNLAEDFHLAQDAHTSVRQSHQKSQDAAFGEKATQGTNQENGKGNARGRERGERGILKIIRQNEHHFLKDMRNEAEAILDKIKNDAANAAAETKKEKDVLFGEIRKASGLVGISASEKYFATQEKYCRGRRDVWGVLIAAFTVAVFLNLHSFYSNSAKMAEHSGMYQEISLRIATLAVLISAAAWCGKIYKALYHQEMVNNHRALCLKTMGAFANATENKDDRDAIVIQASKAVFGNVPTGFVQERSSDSDFNMFAVANQLGRHGSQTQ